MHEIPNIDLFDKAQHLHLTNCPSTPPLVPPTLSNSPDSTIFPWSITTDRSRNFNINTKSFWTIHFCVLHFLRRHRNQTSSIPRQTGKSILARGHFPSSLRPLTTHFCLDSQLLELAYPARRTVKTLVTSEISSLRANAHKKSL